MNRHPFSQRQKRASLRTLFSAALLVLLLTGNVWAAGSAQESMAGTTQGGVTSESLTVPFRLGAAGAQTTNSYGGRTQVKVRGTGQASNTEWSDAFYIFTNAQGDPVDPYHPEDWFMLWINGVPVDAFVDRIPPYNPDHVYVFQISAPEGPLTFAVGDYGVGDNAGEYQIVVRDLPH